MNGIDDAIELSDNQMKATATMSGMSPQRRRMYSDPHNVLLSSPKRYNRVVEALGAVSPASPFSSTKIVSFGGDLSPEDRGGTNGGVGQLCLPARSPIKESRGRSFDTSAKITTDSTDNATTTDSNGDAPQTPTRTPQRHGGKGILPGRTQGMTPRRLFEDSEPKGGEILLTRSIKRSPLKRSWEVEELEKQAWDEVFNSPKRPPKVYNQALLIGSEQKEDGVYERLISLPLKWAKEQESSRAINRTVESDREQIDANEAAAGTVAGTVDTADTADTKCTKDYRNYRSFLVE